MEGLRGVAGFSVAVRRKNYMSRLSLKIKQTNFHFSFAVLFVTA